MRFFIYFFNIDYNLKTGKKRKKGKNYVENFNIYERGKDYVKL